MCPRAVILAPLPTGVLRCPQRRVTSARRPQQNGSPDQPPAGPQSCAFPVLSPRCFASCWMKPNPDAWWLSANLPGESVTLVVGDLLHHVVALTPAQKFTSQFSQVCMRHDIALSTRAGADALAHDRQSCTLVDPELTLPSLDAAAGESGARCHISRAWSWRWQPRAWGAATGAIPKGIRRTKPRRSSVICLM